MPTGLKSWIKAPGKVSNHLGKGITRISIDLGASLVAELLEIPLVIIASDNWGVTAGFIDARWDQNVPVPIINSLETFIYASK